MKKIFTSFLLVFLCARAFSQDTTWVQTYTFDTIGTRRASFGFPASLDDQRFEKVLMYYKLKCSPLTTWDQYNCGEWDYLTYTRIFDHTGVLDSVDHTGKRFKIDTQSPASSSFKTAPFYDQRWKSVSERTPLVTTAHNITGTPAAPAAFMNNGSNGGTMQWIITGSELAASGAVAGDLQGLKLFLASAVSRLEGVKIGLKHTPDAALTNWETTGFTTVFDNTAENLVSGSNEFYFSVPFAWDGTSNVMIEVSVADANPLTAAINLNTTGSAAGMTASYNDLNGIFRTTATNYAEVNLSQVDMGGDFSITFWAKGDNVFGTNSTIFEAVDSLGNRIVNIHFPWTDNNIYFDAGNQNGYDRITKATTAGDVNTMHHWAFVKETSTGTMSIYKDGVLFHSGSNFNRPVGKITSAFLGSSWNQEFNYKGDIDEFTIWTVALDASEISGWMNKKIDATHPDYASLELYYDFDNVKAAADKSPYNRMAMCSNAGMVIQQQYPVAGMVSPDTRPETVFLQGTMNAAIGDSTLNALFPSPSVMFEYVAGNNSFNVVDNQLIYPEGTIDTLNVSGTIIASGASGMDQTITNEDLIYYDEPFELVNDVEIGRYITPYGIQFDLGPQGFTWIYDVTDYQKYLHGMVDLAAHNTQELIDLKFVFIEGIPPRDVHNIEPIWDNFKSYNYANLANNVDLAPQTVELSDSSSMFKIKTRFSGHGQVGDAACCEWVPNDHKIMVNGVERFTWNIWQASECGENPNTSQGGTWPYAREGWCPGDMVKEHDHELTPYVTPGESVVLDYGITPVPANDPGQAGGNYIAALDLVSYSAPNFQHDAAIIDVLNPNNYEYYRKFNPTCSNPRVIIQNTGALPLTKCTIRLWVAYGDWQEFEWTGNLGFLEKEVVEIPMTNDHFWFGTSENSMFYAQIYAVEGSPDLDEYPNNNLFKTHFDLPESIYGPFYVMFNTNNKAAENKWKLVDANENVIFERNSLTNTTQYKDTFNLAPGCYSVILEDSDSDGIGFWYSGQVEGETTGQFRLRLVGGGFIEYFPSDFGAYHRFNFSVGFTLGVDENGKPDESLLIFPNPAAETIRAEFNGYNGAASEARIIDANGRILKTESATTEGSFVSVDMDISDLRPGMYFMQIIGSEGMKTGQFIKQ